MTDYTNHPRVNRLKLVFNELNYHSYNGFAADIGSNQPVVSNYVQGKRVPTPDFMKLVNMRFPQYNLRWLVDGIGDKYNREYVEINPQGNVISNNSNGGDNVIGNKEAVNEIKGLYEQLVESLRSQIKILQNQIDILTATNETLRKIVEKK